METAYEGKKGIWDDYTQKIDSYWRKTITEDKTLSADEIKDLQKMKQDILERNGSGNDGLVVRIKGILSHNEVIKHLIWENDLRKEYDALCDRYFSNKKLSDEEGKKISKRIGELQPMFSDGHI